MIAEASPDQDAAASPPNRLIHALPQLLESLRRADFDVGTEQVLAACDLILALSLRHGEIPERQLRPSLAGLFCTRAEEQQRFAQLFDPWYERLRLQPATTITPSPLPAVVSEPNWLDRLRRQLRRRRWQALALALLIGIVLAVWFWPPPPGTVENPTDKQTIVEDPKPAQPTQPKRRMIPPPQTPAEPVIPLNQYYSVWSEITRQLWLLPVVPWCFWFLSRLLLRQLTLARRRRRPGEEISLKQLQLASDQTRLLTGAGLARTWRQLRRYRSQPMRRLDEAATVARTLAHGGYFRPVYRDRQVPPAYLVLNDRRHAQDHAAALVDELVTTMRRENLTVTLFDYDTDPAQAVRSGDLGLARSPAELAVVYADHDLLLAGDGETLIQHENGREQHRLDAFAPFQRRLMLTLDPVWAQGTRQELFTQADFQQLPLTRQGLAQLGKTTSNGTADHPADLPMPRELAVDPKRWLEERRLGKKARNKLLAQLEGYLGAEGMLLLCATATYPELNWRLTRALDRQLELTVGDRELRLRRLARLPWFRYGRIPDTLRRILLRHLDKTRFRRITGAFNALLAHRDDKPLKLPYAVPKWQGFAAYWKDLRALSARHMALADQVFASVVRGRRPRLLEFSLANLEPGLIGRDWRGLVLPLILGLLLLPAAVWLNLWAWQAWLEPDSRQAALVTMQDSHKSIKVSVAAPEELTQHGEALLGSLRDWGFQVQPLNLPPEATQQPAADSTSDKKNQLLYTPQAAAVEQVLADRLAYLYYGEQPETRQVELDSLPAGAEVQFRLQAAPRVFRDPFISPIQPIEPELVTIQPGRFMMGSSEKDQDAYKSEFPAHPVEITRPFAMGRFEVTFEEYDRFAEATGHDKPDDQGWGRGKRAVINVSWEDAQAYAAWLSQQTGKRYRLPTEAEWEYAARAGTTTRYWWGDEVKQDKRVWANCAGCGSEWGGKETAPVGSFPANPFGLQDTAGNVWEWVEDCWHDNYQNAPADGSAWLDANGGNCDRRVIRGGSWVGIPGYLRSAFRFGWLTVYRLYFRGFRLAQDLSP